MPTSDIAVAVIGGGAAGVAAANKLHAARIDCLLIEARARLGGRAFTAIDRAGHALDLGCGWLHSADRNPWVAVAQAQGRTVDKTTPPWSRPSLPLGFSPADQQDFNRARETFWDRIATAENAPDVPALALLEPGNRWNNLLGAVNTYVSGGELADVSAIDLDRYSDSSVNWRVVEGYGTTVAAHGSDVPVTLENPVRRIDHSGTRIRIETAKGTIIAEQAIIALPTAILAQETALFAPALPAKVDAAAGLPLGLANKLFVALNHAEEFEKESRLFGRTDRVATAIYHLRPFGRPLIECYFGGNLADELDAAGEAAFFDFAATELTGQLGSAFAQRIKPVGIHPWRRDPFARGSYSYAKPGKADCRMTLAAPIDGRLFFAGEACSRHDFSTAHGAFLTGVAAADQVIAVRNSARVRQAH